MGPDPVSEEKVNRKRGYTAPGLLLSAQRGQVNNIHLKQNAQNSSREKKVAE
jgi:hypothetical protein